MFGNKKKEQLKKEETTRTQTEEEERRKREEEEKRRREEEESRKRKEEEERKKKEAERKAIEEKRQKEEKKQKEKEQKEKERQRQRENDKSREAEEKIELAQLEEITLAENESPTLPVDLYHNFTKESFSAYTKLQTFSREQNTHLVMPEFVIIGKQGHGKSSLLEAFLGYPWNVVGYNGTTKRPIYLYVVNSPECKEPKITVKRDSALHEFDSDIQISLKDLQKEITKRNRIFTTEPIYVQYEIADMWNITIIDTPGIISDDKSNASNPSGSAAASAIGASASVSTIGKDSSGAGAGGPNEMNKAKVDSLIYSLCRPLHRHILCVEEAREWERVEMIDFLKPLDPELTRTTFVYTNFVSLLSKYTTTRQINRYLSDTIPAVKTFFVSLFALTARSAADSDEKYKEKVWQAYRRDINILESLQYDKRHEEKMGMYRLRKHLMNMAWLIFQQGVPTILKTIRQKKASAQQDSQSLQKQLKGLTMLKLRTIASNYGVEFLQLVQSMLSGSSVGNPSLIGQTLEEEKSHYGEYEWLDGTNSAIRVLPHEWGIRYYDRRLYGGQQFERLLHEFKAVCEHCEASEVTMDDVATAAGNQFGNYAWASSDLARQKTEEALGPMIEKVLQRSLYIITRLLDLAEKILEERRNNHKKADQHHLSGEKIIDVEDLDNYKYFTFHIKDLFSKYMENIAKNCHEKCYDEFMLTTTIYWDYTEHVDKPPMDSTSDQSKLVIQCTSDIFRVLRTRIIKNVIYKLYNFFLVPIQTDLWNAMQGKLSQLSDQHLEQIFEVGATKEKVNEQIRKLDNLAQQCSALENDLLQVSYQYSHQSHLELD